MWEGCGGPAFVGCLRSTPCLRRGRLFDSARGERAISREWLAGGQGGGLGFVEDGGEVLAGEGVGDGGYFLGGADGDDVTALFAGLGPEVDQGGLRT